MPFRPFGSLICCLFHCRIDYKYIICEDLDASTIFMIHPVEQRQYRLGSFEKQGNSGQSIGYSKVHILLISHYFALNFINFLL